MAILRSLHRTLVGAFLALLSFNSARAAEGVPVTGAASPLDFTLTANGGTPYPLAQHRGKVVLLINTASRCGFTKQYAGLQALHTTYQAKGLVVIGQPANEFGGQEPGTDGEIAEFCTAKFGVTFPLMAKAPVSGAEMIPLYAWLTKESPKPGAIRWNFTKFLIGRDGAVVERFESAVAPDDAALVAAVEKALAAKVP